MPTYEYRCEHGHTFEVMQRMSDDALVSCQTCDAPVQRVFHPVAVHFKGSGFYNTDYGTRRRARETAEAAKAEGSKGEGSKGEGSSKDGSSKDGSSKADSGSNSNSRPEKKASTPASASGGSSD